MKMLPLLFVSAVAGGRVLAQEPAPTAAAAPVEAVGAIAPASAPTTPTTPPPKRTLLKYTPPKDATAGKRLDGDGASRSEKRFKLPKWLYTLTPSSGIGLTTQAQPSLFTFQSEAVPLEYRVTVTEPNMPRPLFIYAVSSSAAGIHRVDLADHNITLKTGVTYEWNVALRFDPKNRASDLIAKGTIKRVAPEAALVEKLKNTPVADHAAVYAEAGIWYDSLAAISDQIAADRENKDLLNLRAGLLEQVGLKEAVAVQ